MTIQQAMQLAIQNHQAGRLAEAEKICRQVLSRQPGNPDALHLLGMIAAQVGQLDAGIELIRRAIAINPAMPHYHINLGNTLQGKGLIERSDRRIPPGAAAQAGLCHRPQQPGQCSWAKGLVG